MTELDPFAPADGIKARWRYCYDLVVGKQPRDEITYEEVMELLECDRQTAQAAMLAARKHLEEDGQYSVETKPKFGWIVMTPAQHIDAAERGEKKMWRAQQRASRPLHVAEAHRDKLSPFERQALDRSQARHQTLTRLRSPRRKSFDEIEAASKARELRRGQGQAG